MPQDLDAEESVLGAIMVADAPIGEVAELLKPADFYRVSHGLIYETALAMYAAGKPVDSIALVDALDKAGRLDDAGGRERLHELAALVPATRNVAHYAGIVKEMALLRGLIRGGGEIAQMGWDRGDDAARLVERAERIVFDLALGEQRSELAALGPALKGVFEHMAELYESGRDITGVPSGLRDLDRLTLGFQPGNLIVLGARPSIGKSALGLCIAGNLTIRHGVPAALFSLEMSREELAQRLLSLEANVELQRIRSGRLHADDWPRMTAAAERLDKAPLYVDDSGTLTLTELRSKARRRKAQTPELGLLIVDYLGLLADVAHARPEHQTAETGRAAHMLKLLAKDLGVPVLALAQLNRNLEQRSDKRPVLADLRQSGQIEEHADLVMFLYRDDYYHEDSDAAGTAELNLAKHRNGPTGVVTLAWQKSRARFGDLAG